MSDCPAAAGNDPARPATGGSLIEAGAALLGAVLELVGDTVRLAAVETRLAVLSLSTMLALAVTGALLLATAWLLLAGALAVWLVRLGLAWEAALLGAALLNVLLCVPLFWLIGRLSRNLLFAATRRHLALQESSADRPTDPG